jgi:hypothetical protein
VLVLVLLLLLLLEPEARNKALVALVALAWRVDDGAAGAVVALFRRKALW